MTTPLPFPKVSVIIPCYNLGAYLKDAIESVKSQTFKDFEIIVVDDGSTETTTIDVLENINDEQVQIFRIKNRGLAGARNYGINKANGQYIVCLDADDMLAPKFLEKTTVALDSDKSKKNAFVTTWLQEFGERCNVWKTSSFDITKLLVTNQVHVGSLFRKEVWAKVGGYKKMSAHGYEDWEFWLSIVENGYKWEVVPEPLFRYRIRKNSMLTAAKSVHTMLYEELYNLHQKLFMEHTRELMIENAKQLKSLHETIGQKDSAIDEYIGYKDEVVDLRKQVFLLRDELHGLKNSRVVGRIITYRKLLGETTPKFKKLPDQIVRKFVRVAARPLPSIFKSKIKASWRHLVHSPIVYRKISNKFWEKQKPLVSIVIPYFNRADTIDETLGSLFQQTFVNFETILVDDGSTDPESIQRLKDIEARHQKIHIIYQKNQGVAAARNNGISSSKGKYIVCLDSDDILEPTYIEKSVIVLESDPDVSLTSTHQQMFGVMNELYKKSPYDSLHLDRDNMVITAAMFRKEAWQESGGYKADIGYEDWEFWLNISEHGYWGKLIPEPLFRYRTSMQSRYVEDKDLHWKNIKKIQTLHPNYQKNIKKLLTLKGNTKNVIEPASAFINLDSTDEYIVRKNNKKNILIAIPWMTFGGAETLIVNFCNEVKDKFNLSFVTGLESEHEWEYKFKEITPNIYHLTNLFEDPKLYLEFISNYVKTRNISVLHIVHTSFMFEMLPELRRRHPKLKVIVTVFNDRAHFLESVSVSKYVDAYTTDNASVANHYLEKVGKEKQITVIPNGINSYDTFNPGLFDRVKERETLGVDQNDLAIFFIGRLSEEKNPDVFLEVAKNILPTDHTKRIKFFVIGDGGMKPQVEKSVASINSKNVTYLGYQSEIPRYLSAADIFVLPSSIEGFPLSILEAMAMRVAVVASDVGAVSEVVDTGRDGFVVAPGSVKEIAETILKLSADTNLLRQVKANARQKIEQKYSNKILGDNYKKLYEGLLK